MLIPSIFSETESLKTKCQADKRDIGPKVEITQGLNRQVCWAKIRKLTAYLDFIQMGDVELNCGEMQRTER